MKYSIAFSNIFIVFGTKLLYFPVAGDIIALTVWVKQNRKE
nr:MAG TPA_asm: hypothetical protein [Caudoviricetes sp.]